MWWPTQIYCGPIIFRQSAVAPYKLSLAFRRPYGPRLATDLVYANIEIQGNQKVLILCQLVFSNIYVDLEHGSENFLWQRTTFVIVGRLASRTCKSNTVVQLTA